jgi:hypothetical protein
MGTGTSASGEFSTAMGQASSASGSHAMAIGFHTVAKGYSTFTAGMYNDSLLTTDEFTPDTNTPLFNIGNGNTDNDRSSALVVQRNGKIYIDPSNKNSGSLNSNALVFGEFNLTGEGILSRRTAGNNQYGLDFFAGGFNRMSISNGGYVGIGNTTPAFPLSFSPTTGDKISLWSNSTNSYGFGIQSSQLQIHTDISAADIAFGYGSSAAFTQTMLLKGNGNLEVHQLKVGNGTLISKQQAGTAVVGSNGSNFTTYTVTFPVAFSGIPKVTATTKNDPAFSNVNDTFVVSVRSVTTTAVTFNILRVDANAAWLQSLSLNWIAWE